MTFTLISLILEKKMTMIGQVERVGPSMTFTLISLTLIFISGVFVIYWLTLMVSHNLVSRTKILTIVTFTIFSGLFFGLGFYTFLGIRQARQESQIEVRRLAQDFTEAKELPSNPQSQLSETTIISYIDDCRAKINSIDQQLTLYKMQLTQNQSELESLKAKLGSEDPQVKTKETLMNSDILKIELLSAEKANQMVSLEAWNNKLQTKIMLMELKTENEQSKLAAPADQLITDTTQTTSGLVSQPAASPVNPPVWVTGQNLGTNEFRITSKQFATYDEALDHAYQELRGFVKESYMKKNNYLISDWHNLLADKKFLRDCFIINQCDVQKGVDLGNGLNQVMHQVHFLAIINDTKLEEVVKLSMKSQINERAYFIQAGIGVIALLFGLTAFLAKK
jgi:hypothetical protein